MLSISHSKRKILFLVRLKNKMRTRKNCPGNWFSRGGKALRSNLCDTRTAAQFLARTFQVDVDGGSGCWGGSGGTTRSTTNWPDATYPTLAWPGLAWGRNPRPGHCRGLCVSFSLRAVARPRLVDDVKTSIFYFLSIKLTTRFHLRTLTRRKWSLASTICSPE